MTKQQAAVHAAELSRWQGRLKVIGELNEKLPEHMDSVAITREATDALCAVLYNAANAFINLITDKETIELTDPPTETKEDDQDSTTT